MTLVRTLPSLMLVLAALAGCSEATPQPDATAQSDVRAGFRAVSIAACEREFRGKGMSQDGVDYLCPCIADELLAAAQTDEALMDTSAATGDAAIRVCLERAPGSVPGRR
jgi:hypothetical protein